MGDRREIRPGPHDHPDLRLNSPADRPCEVSPTRQTLTFREAGVHVVDLDHEGRPHIESGAFAARVPIRQEEVTFKNGDVTLAGTLLLPAAKGKRPALVFVHGSDNRAKCIGASDTSTPHAGLPSSLMTSEASANRLVTGSEATKTWRMTRSREPNFCRPERTLQQIRSAFLGSKSGRVDCSPRRFAFSRGRFRSRFVRRRPVTS